MLKGRFKWELMRRVRIGSSDLNLPLASKLAKLSFSFSNISSQSILIYTIIPSLFVSLDRTWSGQSTYSKRTLHQVAWLGKWTSELKMAVLLPSAARKKEVLKVSILCFPI